MKAFQMLRENRRQTLEALMGNTKGAMTEEEKLDQEDQRIKEVELGKLEELSENFFNCLCRLDPQDKASDLQLIQKGKEVLDTR